MISFATEDTNWRSPRMGIILHARGHDTGYRLDCEKLFDKDERPANPLAWFGKAHLHRAQLGVSESKAEQENE